ncbi:MAG: hypothetical protein KGY38_08705 [Desulfobacterales bacterium]|nr:hypothetical protein [Desulfobacterales bacterium]
MGNRIKTTVLLAVLTVIIMAIGRALGGNGGMVIALVIAGAMNFFSYWYSDKPRIRPQRNAAVFNPSAHSRPGFQAADKARGNGSKFNRC